MGMVVYDRRRRRFLCQLWFLDDEKEPRRGRRWNPSVHTSEDLLRGPVIERDIRVVRKLTRVMKTQWNYNKPIARLIRSPGRRPFNNKTRTCPPRPYSRERTRVGSSCAEKGVKGMAGGNEARGQGRKGSFVWASPRVYVPARELISREPLCSLTDQTLYYGALRSLHARGVYVCASWLFARAH